MFLFLWDIFSGLRLHEGLWYYNYKDTDLNQAIAMRKVSLFPAFIVSAHRVLVTLSNEHQYWTH